jgi:hypothetical protein
VLKQPLTLMVLAIGLLSGLGCSQGPVRGDLDARRPYSLKVPFGSKSVDATIVFKPNVEGPDVYTVQVGQDRRHSDGLAWLLNPNLLALALQQDQGTPSMTAYRIHRDSKGQVSSFELISPSAERAAQPAVTHNVIDVCEKIYGSDTHILDTFTIQLANNHRDGIEVKLLGPRFTLTGAGLVLSDPNSGKTYLIHNFAWTRRQYPWIPPGIGISSFEVERNGALRDGSWVTAVSRGHWESR